MKRSLPIDGIWTAVLLAIGIAGGLHHLYQTKLAIDVPRYAAPTKTTWLRQNWTPGQSAWFHHADQGTLTFGMPYEWFIALDRPQIFPNHRQRLSDADYLDRFGFIPDPSSPGPIQLPVGFAHGESTTLADGRPWLNPQSHATFTAVGLTCAACHTGRLDYAGQEYLVDGAPALTNLATFRQAVGVSILYTAYLPGRFEVFAQRVLGRQASPTAKAALRKQFDVFAAEQKVQLDWDAKVKAKSVDEGFGRLDALNRIGNQVFALDMHKVENYAAISAPVHFPRIWDASWFTWVQYNGSIEQPMVRNAGEDLGVAARLNTSDPNKFQTSVRLDTLYAIETELAGKPPNATDGFSGLRPPRWADTALPPINVALAQRGAALYAQHCQSCHLAPTSSKAFWASPRWTAANSAGQRYLDVELVDIKHVGTDPAQAAGMASRTVQVPAGMTPEGRQSFGPALGQLVEKVITSWYDGQVPPTPAADRDRMNGFRPNGLQAPLKYKSRPLDGIWATPPYLHNGSVPTLYALLSPAGARPTQFYLGNREYDPNLVGYRTEKFKGGFFMDTTKAGNSNSGHEFSNSPGPGVIGPLLNDDQRKALIEYLKTL